MINYYVDYENVKNLGIEGIDEICSKDIVNIFYSVHADSISLEMVDKVLACKGKIKLRKVTTGYPNALDFKLITALLCEIKSKNDYVIISNDKGYDEMIKMANSLNKDNIYRYNSIYSYLHRNDEGVNEGLLSVNDSNPVDEIIPEEMFIKAGDLLDINKPLFDRVIGLNALCDESPDNAKTNKKEIVYDKFKTIIEDKIEISLKKEYIDLIILGANKSRDKNGFYHFFRNKLGQEKGRELYLKVRNEYQEFKNIINNS